MRKRQGLGSNLRQQCLASLSVKMPVAQATRSIPKRRKKIPTTHHQNNDAGECLYCKSRKFHMHAFYFVYSLVQWNWFSDVTGCTWVTCIQWRQRTNFTAPSCIWYTSASVRKLNAYEKFKASQRIHSWVSGCTKIACIRKVGDSQNTKKLVRTQYSGFTVFAWLCMWRSSRCTETNSVRKFANASIHNFLCRKVSPNRSSCRILKLEVTAIRDSTVRSGLKEHFAEKHYWG